MTAPLVESLQLQIKGGHPLVRLAGLIVLGSELSHKKRELGYEGEGSWQAFRDESDSGKRRRWNDYCTAEAGITDRSADYYFQCGEAVKTRLRFSKNPEKAELLREMSVQPSKLTSSQISCLVEKIAKIGLTAGDTQTFLRKEFKAAQPPNRGRSAPPYIPDGPDERRLLALRLQPLLVEEQVRRHLAGMVDIARRLSNPLSTAETIDIARRLSRSVSGDEDKRLKAALGELGREVFGTGKGGRLK